MWTIRPAAIARHGQEFSLRFPILGAGAGEPLWFRLDERFEDLCSDRLDGPLVALLMPAMAAGVDLLADGPVSARLLYYLSGPYQQVLQVMEPGLRRIEVRASEVCSAGERPAGVATGFSAGIDSFCLLADHYYGETSPEFNVTHLLFNNVGALDSDDPNDPDGERLFGLLHDRLAPVAERIGLPLVRVNSNLTSFYRHQGLDQFAHSHTPRNAAVPLLLQAGLGRFLYASAYSYADTLLAGPEGGDRPTMGYADPLALPMLSTETLDACSSGGEYTRVEKTLRVAEIPESYRSLDVCTAKPEHRAAGNCGSCAKCLRTLATLEIAGRLDRYAEVFDLEAYGRFRDRYLGKVIDGDGVYEREIRDLAEQRDFAFPASSRLYARLRGPAQLARKAVRSLTGR